MPGPYIFLLSWVFTGGSAVTSNLLPKNRLRHAAVTSHHEHFWVFQHPFNSPRCNLGTSLVSLLCQGQGDAAPAVFVPKFLLCSAVCSSKGGIKGSAAMGAQFCECSLQEDPGTAGHSPSSARLTGLSARDDFSLI